MNGRVEIKKRVAFLIVIKENNFFPLSETDDGAQSIVFKSCFMSKNHELKKQFRASCSIRKMISVVKFEQKREICGKIEIFLGYRLN